jgi:hypothetical protein
MPVNGGSPASISFQVFGRIHDRHPTAAELALDAVAIGQRRREAASGYVLGQGRRPRDRSLGIRHALDYSPVPRTATRQGTHLRFIDSMTPTALSHAANVIRKVRGI